MSLASFGRKIRLAADFLSQGRLGRLEALRLVEGHPPPLPDRTKCRTCGQALPAREPPPPVEEPRGPR